MFAPSFRSSCRLLLVSSVAPLPCPGLERLRSSYTCFVGGSLIDTMAPPPALVIGSKLGSMEISPHDPNCTPDRGPSAKECARLRADRRSAV